MVERGKRLLAAVVGHFEATSIAFLTPITFISLVALITLTHVTCTYSQPLTVLHRWAASTVPCAAT